LSKQAREVIAKLRKAKDEAEDWVKYEALFDRSDITDIGGLGGKR
jgi:hypothetical protein